MVAEPHDPRLLWHDHALVDEDLGATPQRPNVHEQWGPALRGGLSKEGTLVSHYSGGQKISMHFLCFHFGPALLVHG